VIVYTAYIYKLEAESHIFDLRSNFGVV